MKKTKKCFVLAIFAAVFSADQALAQSTDNLTIRGVVDSYYAYDFSDPDDNLRPGFFYNHNRHNEFSLNLALIHLSYEGERARGQLGLMAGTYAEYNYAAELPMLRSVYEAWAGFQLAENVWWDAGVFPSHIGWEAAISLDNPTLTRSIASANSPFYLAGTRLYWQANSQWTIGLVLANGWQNISETPDNDAKGGGTQVTWSPSDQLTLNSSTWFSDEFPQDDSRLRLFHDFYAIVSPTQDLTIILGFDIGAQKSSEGAESNWDLWFGGALITRFAFNERVAAAARIEYFSDPDQVIIGLDREKGLETFGASANVDVLVADPVMFRLEARALRADEDIFLLDGDPSELNLAATASLAISFDASVPMTR